MRRVVLILAVVSAVAVPAAALELVASEAISGSVGGQQCLLQGCDQCVYSNTTNGPSAGAVASPCTEIGDDLAMTASGRLCAVSFSVYNSNTSSTQLEQADLVLRFYYWDGNAYLPSGELLFDDIVLDLDPGYYMALTASDLEWSGINLTSQTLATLEICNNVGGDKMGQVLLDPPTIGSSTEDYFKDGSWYSFGGSPVANFYWEIWVPEPATLFLFALGSLGLLRRKRP